MEGRNRNNPNNREVFKLNNKNYVSHAENVIKGIKGKDLLTTNKIRSILSLITEIYEMSRKSSGEKLDEKIINQIQYVKMRYVYEAGKDIKVRTFIDESNLLECIDKIGDSKGELILFCHYVEALVAYHKYNTKER